MESKLNPRIKTAADKVYNLDKQKFSRLIKWIMQAQKYGYSPESIAATLDAFYPHAMDVKNWYGYLNDLIDKLEPKLNARASEAEHRRVKEETREAARKLFE